MLDLALELDTSQLSGAPETKQPIDDADVFAALQAYYADRGRRLRNYERYERRDFTGGASHKVRVGGALVIKCTVFAEDTFSTDIIEINEHNRPLDEAVITCLGEGAPVRIRDILTQ
jgi:hypothetical protein